MNPTQLLAALAAQAAQGVQTNTPADGYVRVAGRLMEHASRWSAVSASGLKCSIVMVTPHGEHVRCVASGIGVCISCESAVCFNHALISPNNGDMVCYGCVAKLTGASPNPKQERDPGPAPGPQPADQCSCRDPWKLDADCPIHGRASQSSDDTARKRRRYLRVLDLDEDCDWEDIRYAYKQMMRKHHPDRHPPSRRKRQEQRVAKINAAYAWLKKHHEEAA